MLKYIDTATEDIERLKDARKHINMAMFLMSYLSIICLIIFVVITSEINLIYLVLTIYCLVTSTCLIVKREIYSAMIFLRGKE